MTETAESIESLTTSLDRDIASFWLETTDVSHYNLKWISSKLPGGDRGHERACSALRLDPYDGEYFNCTCDTRDRYFELREPAPFPKRALAKPGLFYILVGIVIAVMTQWLLGSPFFGLCAVVGFVAHAIRLYSMHNPEVLVSEHLENSGSYSHLHKLHKLQNLAAVESPDNLGSELLKLSNTVLKGILVDEKLTLRNSELHATRNKLAGDDMKTLPDRDKILDRLKAQMDAISDARDDFGNAMTEVDHQVELIEIARKQHQFMQEIAGLIKIDDLDEASLVAALQVSKDKIEASLSSLKFLSS